MDQTPTSDEASVQGGPWPAIGMPVSHDASLVQDRVGRRFPAADRYATVGRGPPCVDYHRTMATLPALPELAPGLYRHYKGNDYEVVTVARHSETLEPVVVYRALYGDGGLWVRPYAMFCGEVEAGGRLARRFAPVG